MYKHYFGDEYDVEKIRLKVLSHLPNDRCLHCHDNLLARPGNSAARIAQQHYRTQKPRKIDVSSVMRMSGINFKINYFRRKGSLSG